MDLFDLCTRARTVRRFREALGVDPATVLELVEAAGMAPCAANLQELRYMIVLENSRREALFPLLSWAGYLEDWPGPGEGERPAGYAVILVPSEEKAYTRIDAGIAAGYITLDASAHGLGACILMSFDSQRMHALLGAPEGLKPLLVIALGEPAEEVVLENVGPDGGVEYWRDGQGVHHVPKRAVSDLIVT
jgi:nitroreductase